MKKIAITQRLIENTSYFEVRDCLDTNWTNLFKSLSIIPIILPTNYPIENFIDNGITIDGLILSGGNDLNNFNPNNLSEIRDNYELKLIEFFVKNKIPILGLCRGMQLLSNYFGAKFEINKTDYQQTVLTHLNVNSSRLFLFLLMGLFAELIIFYF